MQHQGTDESSESQKDDVRVAPDERRRVIEDYVADLRELLKTLRRRLN
jgi:hypothetical protein